MTAKNSSSKRGVHKQGGQLPHPALTHLKKVDPLLYKAALPHHHAIVESLAHRRNYAALFPALAGSIVSQQLSTKAADTIWGRLEKACKGEVTPEKILRMRETTLRKAGLSAAKVKSLKELSRALTSGSLDLRKLATMKEEEAVVALSSVWGIGRWTAEMFLIFALEREDVFSLGDLGLRRSVEALYGLQKDAPLQHIEAIAAVWAPYRSYASRVLWRVRDAKPEN